MGPKRPKSASKAAVFQGVTHLVLVYALITYQDGDVGGG
jgi:hypothetical protein